MQKLPINAKRAKRDGRTNGHSGLLHCIENPNKQKNIQKEKKNVLSFPGSAMGIRGFQVEKNFLLGNFLPVVALRSLRTGNECKK